jgi:flagellar FliL protein
MAEEVEEVEAEEPKGGNKGIMIMMAVNMLALIGVLGFLMLKADTPASTAGTVPTAEGASGAAAHDVGPSWALDPLIVNLRVPEGTRYLKITLEFELIGDKHAELIEERKNRIKDSVIELLSDYSADDVVGAQNKRFIKDRLLAKLNQQMEGEAGGNVFREVFVPEFLVQ